MLGDRPAQGEGAQGVDGDGDRVDPRERLQPAGHARHRDEGRGGEHQREHPDEPGRLGRLDVAHRQADEGRDPGEGQPERQGQGDRADRGHEAGVEAEPDQGADDQHQQDHEQVADGVGQGAAGEHGRAGHGQGAEPVDHAPRHVLGQGDAGLGGAEDHRLDQDPGHQEVDVVLDPRHLDGAAEHVGEQQHEHDRLDGREQQQGRDADVAVEVAPGHGGGVGEGPAQRAPGGGAGGHGAHALLLAGRRPRPRGGPPEPWSSPASASAT